MGYYTDYTFELPDEETFILASKEFDHWDNTDVDSKRIFFSYTKWYEHEIEIAAFSTRFPDVLFTLTGFGEEHSNIWRKYFKNGKVYRVPAQILFDSFDESQLRDPA